MVAKPAPNLPVAPSKFELNVGNPVILSVPYTLGIIAARRADDLYKFIVAVLGVDGTAALFVV